MATNISRKKFISQSAKSIIAVSATSLLYKNSQSRQNSGTASVIGNFDQTPLPYTYNALEPVIDAATMELHYSKHAAAYSNNAKEAVMAMRMDTSIPLEELFTKTSQMPGKLRNNAGGHYNHELFWKCMKPNGKGKPSGVLMKAIEKQFGSFEAFKAQFTDAAKNRFGSGWAWLVAEKKTRKLKIGNTANQDNPLMDVAEFKGFPLIGLDVWEHAYYLKYQNRRAEYIENWWKVVNWEFVQQRFEGWKG
jgi:Fe-Mn family superoxide dismutase